MNKVNEWLGGHGEGCECIVCENIQEGLQNKLSRFFILIVGALFIGLICGGIPLAFFIAGSFFSHYHWSLGYASIVLGFFINGHWMVWVFKETKYRNFEEFMKMSGGADRK
ncbi:MAG: hypothetical protein V3U92_19530 [Cellulophaga sp.]